MFRKTGYALLAATLALGVSTFSPANAAEKLRLTMASGHPEVFLWIKHLKATFIPTLAECVGACGHFQGRHHGSGLCRVRTRRP